MRLHTGVYKILLNFINFYQSFNEEWGTDANVDATVIAIAFPVFCTCYLKRLCRDTCTMAKKKKKKKRKKEQEMLQYVTNAPEGPL